MHEDEGESFVIINNIEATEGEMIDGFKILKIHRDRVTIEKDGESFDLKN